MQISNNEFLHYGHGSQLGNGAGFLSTLCAISKGRHIGMALQTSQMINYWWWHVTRSWFIRQTHNFSALSLSFFFFFLPPWASFTMSRSSSLTLFADELEDLMRPASPSPLKGIPESVTAVTLQIDSNNIDMSIPSSIGPIRNELAYARHLARQNKLNATQRVLLDKLVHVRFIFYHSHQIVLDVF